jgi:3-oxoacid CoA-transferase
VRTLPFLPKTVEIGSNPHSLFSYAAQNFSGAMARSAKMTIVEAEEIVPVGSIDPNEVHLPGILCVASLLLCCCIMLILPPSVHSVNRVVKSETPKRVEFEVLREEKSEGGAADASLGKDEARLRRERIVKRAAKELKEGVRRFQFM